MTKCSFWLFVFRNAPGSAYSAPNPVGTENIAATSVPVKSKSRSGTLIPVILPPSASFTPHGSPSVVLKSRLLLALCTILHAIWKSPNKSANAPFSTFHSRWRPIFHTEKRDRRHDMRTTRQWHARIKIPISWDWFFIRLWTVRRYAAFMQKNTWYTYIYANHPHRFGLKLQPVCQPEVLFSDFLTAKEVIIPIFATYHILYSPRKTVERSKKGNQAPKQTVAWKCPMICYETSHIFLHFFYYFV